MQAKIRKDKLRKRVGRRGRVAKKTNRSSRPRLTVFRTAKHIYAQIIDSDGRTLTAVSSRSKELRGEGYGGNVDAARRVGKAVAEAAKGRKIEQVVFNRNGFLYHGRVKALADAAREAGLKF